MFLEIHDKNKNDIVIYSQNIFDMDENFRIIYKEALQKRHQNISLSDVYDFINYPLPKNLILYRLLTNYDAIKASDSKHGFLLFVDDRDELLYLDPIFALKDLPNLIKDYNLKSFRFKIQQCGIKTLTYVQEKERYTEVFSYDLYALEAQNQNDKIFADALFPEENDFFEGANLSDTEEKQSGMDERIDNFNEDPSPGNNSFNKPDTNDISIPAYNKFEQKELLKKVLGIDDKTSKDQFPKLSTTKEDMEKGNLSSSDYSNLFKKTDKISAIKERENGSIVLKLSKP